MKFALFVCLISLLVCIEAKFSDFYSVSEVAPPLRRLKRSSSSRSYSSSSSRSYSSGGSYSARTYSYSPTRYVKSTYTGTSYSYQSNAALRPTATTYYKRYVTYK